MKIELKKRIYTSLILITLLYLMSINLIILIFSIFIASLFSFFEFFNITNKIFKKNNFLKLFANLFFVSYVFSFGTLFVLFSQLFELKVLIYTCLFICIFSDIGGLVFGRYFKGKKLTIISPKKTISGSVGSFLFSIITSYIFTIMTINQFSWHKPLVLAIFVSLTCQAGDIFFSFLKRKAKIKDTGNILPGHGGILDRIDGIIIGMPLGILLTLIFYAAI